MFVLILILLVLLVLCLPWYSSKIRIFTNLIGLSFSTLDNIAISNVLFFIFLERLIARFLLLISFILSWYIFKIIPYSNNLFSIFEFSHDFFQTASCNCVCLYYPSSLIAFKPRCRALNFFLMPLPCRIRIVYCSVLS